MTRSKFVGRSGAVLLAFVTTLTAACAAPEKPPAQEPVAGLPTDKPVEEMVWLRRFCGEWDMRAKVALAVGEDAPTAVQGVMKSRTLGDRWVVSEFTMNSGGETVVALQAIGYDPAQEKYVATWVDNVTSHMWRQLGVFDGGRLVLEADGPSCFEEGKQAKYRDVYEFASDDTLVHSSTTLGQDGAWVEFMRSEYRRR